MSTAVAGLYVDDTKLIRLARDIAADLNDIETILEANKISQEQFERIKQDPRFTKVLEAEISAWHAADNTLERTRLKAGMLIEEWLPEANARIHDKGELLSSKNEVVKTLARIAGMGERMQSEGGGGERLVVTINLGADQKLSFEKTVTSKVIEHEPQKLEST